MLLCNFSYRFCFVLIFLLPFSARLTKEPWSKPSPRLRRPTSLVPRHACWTPPSSCLATPPRRSPERRIFWTWPETSTGEVCVCMQVCSAIRFLAWTGAVPSTNTGRVSSLYCRDVVYIRNEVGRCDLKDHRVFVVL